MPGDNKSVNTLRLTVDPDRLNDRNAIHEINRAAEILRAGGLVALPTETVYGLGANALDSAAVEKIFAAKQRPSWDPVIVHIAGPDRGAAMLNQLVAEVPEAARRLMDKFWPGPLTLLLPRSAAVPDAVTAGRPLVGVRMPAHPVALELIRRAGVPVAAPSANLFGHISPTTAAHVLEDLDGRIDAVLDAGPTEHGVESTVLDPCQSPMLIYRPGAVTAEEIQEIAGPVEIFREGAQTSNTPSGTAQKALPSPGVGLRHYAPRARLILVEGPEERLGKLLEKAALEQPGERVGVMLPFGVDSPLGLAGCSIFFWGRWKRPLEMARDLYAGLRTLDQVGCTVILCPMPPAEGIGVAIRDRLSKGAKTETQGLRDQELRE